MNLIKRERESAALLDTHSSNSSVLSEESQTKCPDKVLHGASSETLHKRLHKRITTPALYSIVARSTRMFPVH